MIKMIDPTIKPPEEECQDRNCPYHGNLSVRGQVLEGRVVSDKMDKTVVVERGYAEGVPKYERYERRSSRILAHNPPCINAQEEDVVKIGECKSLSKQKAFVVIEKKEGE